MEISPILIPIFAVVGFFAMIILVKRYDYLEKTNLINKGFDPRVKNQKMPFQDLRLPLLMLGAGIGLILGSLIGNEVGYFSMVLIFGGIGLVIAYLIYEKKEKEERKINEDKIEREKKEENQYIDR